MTNTSPGIKLNNGVEMPVLGLGVMTVAPPDQRFEAVEAALQSGYRLIDTAAAYMNEERVGEAIRKSGLKRSEVFVTTKLWISDYGYDRALHGFDRSLRKLGLDYIDLYLLHQPVPTEFGNTAEAYRAAEKLLADKRVRAIGVSNFSTKHVDDLMRTAKVTPAVNQIEVHPFFSQRELVGELQRRGIVPQAWSPIGGINRYTAGQTGDDPFSNKTIRAIAEKHSKTPAQVILRWHIEHGVAPIPKSVRAERIAENIDVFDFKLTPEEVAAIDALDKGVRSGPDPETFSLKVWDFRIPD
jgi:diketogulonate reductase-like aldo/keto reductase